MWIPLWLLSIGTRMDIAEWKTMTLAYHGRSAYERELELIHKLRRKYGSSMPDNLEEQVERVAQELLNDRDFQT